MTLYTSDKKTLRHSAIIYVSVAAFCVLFSTVYEHFSHGVYSNFMVLLFLFPLVAAIPPFVLPFFKFLPSPTKTVRNMWALGTATLTVGSCLKGVFDIYGTTSSFVGIYWYIGGLMTACSVIFYLWQCFKETDEKRQL